MNLFEATDPEHFAYEPLVIKRVSKETEEASERLYDHVEQLDKKEQSAGVAGSCADNFPAGGRYPDGRNLQRNGGGNSG
ncbi:MAG: hypothetical protein V8S32_00910 [Lachnospiraceae bacterium]